MLLLLAAVWTMPDAVHAQENPTTVGEAVGAGLEQVRDGMQQFSQGKAALSQTIREAREAYWTAYLEGGADLAEAEAAYEHALYLKDFSFLAKSFAGRQSGAAAELMALLEGEPIDGGIPDSAAFAFARWADGVYSSLVRGGGAFVLSPSAWEPGSWQRAFEENEALYQVYREVRNETAFRGVREHQGTPRGYANAMGWNDDDCLGTDVYDGMLEALGKAHVDAAIQAVVEAPKDERGRIADLAALGLFKSDDASGPSDPVPAALTYLESAFPAPVLRALLTRGTPERYLHSLFHRGCRLSFDPGLYDSFVGVYGEDAVRAALDRVERAPKLRGNNRILDPEAFGLSGYVTPADAFQEAIRQDPEGYARSLVKEHLRKEEEIEAPTAERITAAYDALVAEHGEETVLKAAVEIREMGGRSGARSARPPSSTGSARPRRTRPATSRGRTPRKARPRPTSRRRS